VKVIHQLISYFHERGRFSDEQLEEFIKKGFWGIHDPMEMRSLEARIGESFYFQVSADVNGPLWGTDIYTSDSSLGKACVHAGVLAPGESGIVKVTIVKPILVFSGSTRNGVASSSWTTPWSGAFTVEKFR
jgi:LCCL domain